MTELTTYTFEPKVNPSREFLEIASDFSNPLDIVREAISNSFDAKAKNIYLLFEIATIKGRKRLKITIRDDGEGMNEEGINSFFDLGNSSRRDIKDIDTTLIGEKGHGTKIYFNSDYVNVITGQNGKEYTALMLEPLSALYDNKLPTIDVNIQNKEFKGTYIEIIGYNNDERSVFTHDIIKDHIYWFTKFGSFENIFDNICPYNDIKIHLKGLDKDHDEVEVLTFGHIFPEESENLNKLLEKYLSDAPDHFVKRLTYDGTLEKFPDIEYQAVFYIEGNKAKQKYNPMIRRSGYKAPEGAYKVQDRYGIWLCKDFIPVQRKNDWITKKGSEYTKFHAFFNCQDLKLTANRGSLDNTSSEILEAIQSKVVDIYNDIIESSYWEDLEYLEQSSQAFLSERKEEKNYETRKKHILQNKIAIFNEHILREPRQEHGVFALYHTLDILKPDLFPFEIVDYDTHAGIDVLAQLRKGSVSLEKDALFFVEFKNILKNSFNHSFNRLYGIVCFKTELKNNDVVVDAFETSRTFRCYPKDDNTQYTQYFLEDERHSHKIEVIVLEEYLFERLNLKFTKQKI
ncbi:ATP-binding protein [Solibacillus sp. FSL K6-1523]|uniref:ATP-binding protein n=1 Tax=Solibacillus sp. FSL K6-1523 TaxID=2921471 RepID=UPI0030F53DDD